MRFVCLRSYLVAAFVLLTLALAAAPAAAAPRRAGVETLAALAVQQAELTQDSGAAYDHFGVSVAISGDTALVGAYYEDDVQGAAYVFVRSGGVWSLQQRLVASDPPAGVRFGYAVALDGDTALVGAFGFDGGSGAAYVFTRSGGVWSLQQRLRASDAGSLDLFGWSVALDGDTAVVGAPHKAVGQTIMGAVYVFARSGDAWSEQDAVPAPEGPDFGDAVAVEGDTLLAGSTGNMGQGAAWVYTRSGGAWSRQAKLVASDAAVSDRFGDSVALSAGTALVGAPYAAIGGQPKQGAVYEFKGSGSDWSQQDKLVASDGDAGDEFGSAVALEHDTAVVGALNTLSGAAYLLKRAGGGWSEEQLTAEDAAPGDAFGGAVALSGQSALVGAPYKMIGTAPGQGAAYVFVWPLTIHASAGPGGIITPSGDVPVESGATPTFTYRAATGFRVSRVLVNGVAVALTSTGTYTFQPVTADQTISVEFAPQTFTISAVASSPGGTVSPRSTTLIPFGGSLTVNVTPAPGYHVSLVTVDGRPVTLQNGAYTLAFVASDHRLQATFAPDSFAVTPSVVPGADGRSHGAISPALTGSFPYGSTPTYRFTPDGGYVVFEVRVDGVPVSPTPRSSYTFAPLTGPHTISVRFARIFVPGPQ